MEFVGVGVPDRGTVFVQPLGEWDLPEGWIVRDEQTGGQAPDLIRGEDDIVKDKA